MMPREEAIAIIARLAHTEAKWPGTEDTLAALDLAIAALRPVSREQVEKVWSGCESCKNAGLAIGEVQFYGPFEWSIDVSGNMHYCPNCGRPITPVAKERQVERLEALKDEAY